jgi:hypothetical protein
MATQDAPLQLTGFEYTYLNSKVRGYIRWKGPVPARARGERFSTSDGVFKKLILPKVLLLLPVRPIPVLLTAAVVEIFHPPCDKRP